MRQEIWGVVRHYFFDAFRHILYVFRNVHAFSEYYMKSTIDVNALVAAIKGI